MDCSPALLGLLIGRGGWTLKKIIRESGAHITINNTLVPTQPRRIIIYGPRKNVLLAEGYVKRITEPQNDGKDAHVDAFAEDIIREAVMRKQGILPSRPNPIEYHDGNQYSSYHPYPVLAKILAV